MPDINTEIGKLIRGARKKRGMTLNELAEVICKSQSTVSKYEKGEITVDIATLYDIADALRVHVEQLLYVRPERTELRAPGNNPAFFTDTSQFYSYLFDGRSNSLMRCVFDVLSKTDERKYKIMMYMNFEDFDNYKNCENTYWGYIEHYDAVTNIALTN